MTRSITPNDAEPTHEWINKLAREAADERLFPEAYKFHEVESVANGMAGSTLDRRNELLAETTLSEREAEVIALKEAGLTHAGIALVMSMVDDGSGGASRNTVDEYVRRAREKYREAVQAYEHLDGTFDS